MPAGLEALPPPPALPGPLPLAGQVLAVAFATVTGATNASPVVVSTAAPHYLVSGVAVTISGVVGNTAANTTAVATVLTPTTFSIPVAGNGAYVSGGAVTVNVLAQSVVIADPTTPANQAGVTAGGALKVDATANPQPVSGSVGVSSLPAIPTGANAIGTVGVTALPALPAGSNAIGTVGVTALPALPAGANALGSVTANAGTNLNTSALATAANQTAPAAPGASPVAAGIPSLLYGADGKPLTYGQTGDRVPTTALTQPRQGNRAIRGRFTPHPVVESKVAVAAFSLSGWAGTAKISSPLNVAPHTRLLLWAALAGAVGSATTLQLQVSFLDQWSATWIPLADPALAAGGLLALDGTKTGTGGAGSGWLTQFPDWLQVTLTAATNSYTAGTLAVYVKVKS